METAVVILYEGKKLIPERVNDLLKVTMLVIELALRPNFLHMLKYSAYLQTGFLVTSHYSLYCRRRTLE